MSVQPSPISSESKHDEAHTNDLIARLNARRRKASQEPTFRVLITESQSQLARSIMRHILKKYPYVHLHAGVPNVDEIALTDFNDILDDDPAYPSRLHFLSTPIDQPIKHSDHLTPSQSTLVKAFRGVDAAFILPSFSHIDLSGRAYIEAAKQAQTKFVALYGILDSAQSYDECMKLKFASVYRPLEQALADTGLSHCILRAPFFLDSIVDIHHSEIKQNSSFSTPVHADKRQIYLTQSDFAEACARVMTDPKEKHEMATYALFGKGTMTYQKIADCLSQHLHRTIKYARCSDDEMRSQLKKARIDQWLIEGLIEQYHEHDEERTHLVEDADDFKSIVGRDPESYEEYCKAVAPRFR